MPGEPDGVALAERPRNCVPIFACSTPPAFAAAGRFDRHVVHGKVLGKPYRPSQLASEVENLLAR